MTSGDPWGLVDLSLTDDGLLVFAPTDQEAPARRFGAAVPLLGGTAIVDVTALAAPIRAVVADASVAGPWLRDVYGEEVAAAATGLTGPVRATATKGFLSDTVVRCGLGMWLHRWWPSAPGRAGGSLPEVDRSLLEIELGGLLWYAESAFGTAAPSHELLGPHLEQLVALVESGRAHDVGWRGQLSSRALRCALEAAVDCAPEELPGYAECAALLERIEAEEAVFAAEVGDPGWRALLAHTREHALEPVSRRAGAVRARHGHPLADELAEDEEHLAHGRFTVDEELVSPGLYSTAEDNGQWVVFIRDDTTRVRVAVEASRSLLESPEELQLARVVPVPGAAPQLLRATYAAGRFTGEAALGHPPADLTGLRADVTSALFTAPPDLSPDADTRRRARLDQRDGYLAAQRLEPIRGGRLWPGDSEDPRRPWVAELVAVANQR